MAPRQKIKKECPPVTGSPVLVIKEPSVPSQNLKEKLSSTQESISKSEKIAFQSATQQVSKISSDSRPTQDSTPTKRGCQATKVGKEKGHQAKVKMKTTCLQKVQSTQKPKRVIGNIEKEWHLPEVPNDSFGNYTKFVFESQCNEPHLEETYEGRGQLPKVKKK